MLRIAKQASVPQPSPNLQGTRLFWFFRGGIRAHGQLPLLPTLHPLGWRVGHALHSSSLDWSILPHCLHSGWSWLVNIIVGHAGQLSDPCWRLLHARRLLCWQCQLQHSVGDVSVVEGLRGRGCRGTHCSQSENTENGRQNTGETRQCKCWYNNATMQMLVGLMTRQEWQI